MSMRDKFLNVLFDAVPHPASEFTQQAAAAVSPVLFNFDSCFFSYSTKDEGFAKILYGDLTKSGVKCWFSPHDIRGGMKLHDQIHNAIYSMDKFLLILSKDSIQSPWVETEIRKARSRALLEKRQILFPIRLISMENLQAWNCFDSATGTDLAQEIRDFYIPDFSQWQNPLSYRDKLEWLLRNLRQTC